MLGLIFLPEFGRALGEVRGSVGRISRVAGALKPRKGSPRPFNLLFPAGRAAAAAGGVLAAGGGVLLAYGIAGFETAGAQAVDPGLFAEEDSGTRKILSFLTDLPQDNSPVLGQMLFVFNSGVLVLAGFLLIWHTVTGSVATAREGRWGFGAWEVVRIVVAIAMMAPLPGGASAAQHVIFGLARLGGDFANVVWKPMAEEALEKGRSVVPWPREREWRAVLGRTLVAEVCMYVANGEAQAAGHQPYVIVRTAEERGKPHPNPRMRRNRPAPVTGEAIHYDGNGRGLPRSVCGAVRFGGLNEEGARGISARAHRDAWAAAHPGIVRAAMEIGDHYVAGTAVANRSLPDVSGMLDAYGVAVSYAAVLELGMKEAGDAGLAELEEKLAEDAAKIGWLGAASFVNTLAASAARVQSAATNLPEASLYSGEISKASPKAEAAVGAVLVNLAQDRRYAPIPLALAAGVAGVRAPAEGRGGSLMDQILRFIGPETMMVVDSGNPLLDLAHTGAALINGGMGAMGLLAGVSAGVNLLEGIPFFGKGLDFFEATWDVTDGLVTTLIGIVLIAGAVLLYVVPAIPFIRFLFGILSWLVAVVEGMLAVTVFCAAHVTRGDGNRLATDATREGWLFFPALILRPVLMLFGLVLGYFLFVVGIGLFNEVWLPRMQDAGRSEGLGLVDWVAMLALYVMVAYGMLNACFKMIDGLPNAVLGWIGSRAGGGGDAEEVMGMATGGFGRAGGLRMGFRGPSRAAQVRNARSDD